MADLAASVLDWSRQQTDFAQDGAVREIVILDAVDEDWNIVLPLIAARDPEARLKRDGRELSLQSSVDVLFAADAEAPMLEFEVDGIALTCVLHSLPEIALSFWPSAVTESALLHLLRFVVAVGDAVHKIVLLTVENASRRVAPEIPIFKYEPAVRALKYLPT